MRHRTVSDISKQDGHDNAYRSRFGHQSHGSTKGISRLQIAGYQHSFRSLEFPRRNGHLKIRPHSPCAFHFVLLQFLGFASLMFKQLPLRTHCLPWSEAARDGFPLCGCATRPGPTRTQRERRRTACCARSPPPPAIDHEQSPRRCGPASPVCSFDGTHGGLRLLENHCGSRKAATHSTPEEWVFGLRTSHVGPADRFGEFKAPPIGLFFSCRHPAHPPIRTAECVPCRARAISSR